jgi:hypothetical protein
VKKDVLMAVNMTPDSLAGREGGYNAQHRHIGAALGPASQQLRQLSAELGTAHLVNICCSLRHMRKTAKSDYYIRHARPSVRP